MKNLLQLACLAAMVCSLGCRGDSAPSTGGPTQSFTLAWSEYPSWSVFGVAHEQGLIDKDEGKRGSIENKWNIDIVLKLFDYETCLSAYGNGTADGVCITNMDILPLALGRNSVAVFPTSTSDGADACLVTGIQTLDDLAGKDTYGLEKSVSQYTFERNLELAGKDPANYPFKQMDPAQAAQAMQTSQASIQSIVVWNPFVLETERSRPDDVKRLFDSKTIPEEIIDMVVVGQDVLERPGGQSFAAALAEAFYKVNDLLASSTQGDKTLVALGENFSSLGLEDMKIVVQETKFYKSPSEGMTLFEKASFQNETMPKVVDFCATHDIIESKPSVAFGDGGEAQLRFTTRYMQSLVNNASAAAAAATLQDATEFREVEDQAADDAAQ